MTLRPTGPSEPRPVRGFEDLDELFAQALDVGACACLSGAAAGEEKGGRRGELLSVWVRLKEVAICSFRSGKQRGAFVLKVSEGRNLDHLDVALTEPGGGGKELQRWKPFTPRFPSCERQISDI